MSIAIKYNLVSISNKYFRSYKQKGDYGEKSILSQIITRDLRVF